MDSIIHERKVYLLKRSIKTDAVGNKFGDLYLFSKTHDENGIYFHDHIRGVNYTSLTEFEEVKDSKNRISHLKESA